jgi:hypothetical protein
MAPKLSKIQRTELENVIISKLQGVEVMTDKEIRLFRVPLEPFGPRERKSSKAVELTATERPGALGK